MRIKWVLFTKRTNEPKLNYIEQRLNDAGIKHKRDGRSFHAPCLFIDERDQGKAWAILDEKWSKNTFGPNPRGRTALDDIPDDDERFAYHYARYADIPEHEIEGTLANFNRYIAGDR